MNTMNGVSDKIPGATESVDVLEAFLRRGDKKSAPMRNTNLAYADESKPLPAWMKKNEPLGKYDKYGRRDDPRSGGNDSDRYAKYKRAELGSDSRETRIRREPERNRDRDGNDELDPRKRYRTTSTMADLRRGGNVREFQSEKYPDNDPQDHEGPAAYLRVAVRSHLPQGPTEYQDFRLNIRNKDSKDINLIVRTHYNQKTYHLRLVDRSASPIIKLRHFNNVIKYMLLGENVHKRAPGHATVILDLCCGKGGDLNKFEFVGCNQMIGIDISDASIKEAFKRYSQNKARFIPQLGSFSSDSNIYKDLRKYNFEACFATGDCFTKSVPEILEPVFPGIVDQMFPVDCVLIQFALHYAFESEEKVKALLNNVSKSLRPGGMFVGTIPSLEFIKNKIVNKEWIETESGKKKFGNGLYSATFYEEPAEDGSFKPPYGIKYDYSLTDAIDDVPEYVVPFELFRLLCEDYGLTLKFKKSFTELFNEEIPKYFNKLNKKIIQGMKRLDGKYGAEGLEKEAVAFYLAFAFEKVGA